MIRRNPKITKTCGRESVPSRAREAYALHCRGWQLVQIAEKYGVSESSVNSWMQAVRNARRDRVCDR